MENEKGTLFVVKESCQMWNRGILVPSGAGNRLTPDFLASFLSGIVKCVTNALNCSQLYPPCLNVLTQ